MVVRIKDSARLPKTHEGMARDEIDRVNARLRHFRGVAAGVMREKFLPFLLIVGAAKTLRYVFIAGVVADLI